MLVKTRTPTGHFPDVSHFQTGINFSEIAGSGIKLVITKATEGTGYTDPTYPHFADQIRRNGMTLGAYIFARESDARLQINHFLHVANLKRGDLQPVVDAELDGLSLGTVESLMSLLGHAGYRPILYASLSFWRDVLGSPTDFPLWLAAYRDSLPDLPASVTLFAWQHTQVGTCPGIPNPCDMSYYYGDMSQFIIGGTHAIP